MQDRGFRFSGFFNFNLQRLGKYLQYLKRIYLSYDEDKN